MTEQRLHSRVVRTVFDLLGANEDDITYGLGWALAQSDDLAYALLGEFFNIEAGELVATSLQKVIAVAGRTDIELETEHTHLILEAKRGWNLETEDKLAIYASRFEKDKAREPVIAVIAEASPERALPRLPSVVGGVPVKYASWQRLAELVAQSAADSRSNAEKKLLRELGRYLKGVMTVRDVNSNLVYVVSLATYPLIDDGPSFADIVAEHNSYVHPFGGTGGWPKEPPNYLGFRFDGRLTTASSAHAGRAHPGATSTVAASSKSSHTSSS